MNSAVLTDVQTRVLSAIREYVQSNDCPPTVREIQDAADLSSRRTCTTTSACSNGRGSSRRTPDVARGIEVVADADARRRAALVSVQVLAPLPPANRSARWRCRTRSLPDPRRRTCRGLRLARQRQLNDR